MAADISAVSYFAPIAAFLIVFAVSYAVLVKTKVLEDKKWGLLLISFLIAAIFVSAAGTRDYVLTIVPWIAILIISVFFILLLSGFIGEEGKWMSKTAAIVAVVALALIFLVSAFFVYSDILVGLVPGPSFGSGDTPVEALFFFDWLYSPRVVGAIVLIIASAIVSWILVKSK